MASMSRDQLDTLFKEYETAFDKLDLKKISGYCADSFISAGPKGSITQSRKDFEKKAEQTNKFYKSVGRTSARIISKRLMPICNDYSMVVVRWGITFDKTGNKLIEDGKVDMVSYGRLFISNPDLVKRFSLGLEIAKANEKQYYTPGPEGYIDYPKYKI